MRLLFVFAYLAIEIGAFAAMVAYLGLGWALLITLAAAVIGLFVLQRQGRRIFGELRRASRNEVDPRGPLTDTALLAGSTVLMVIPGAVSSVAGLILLAPPIRKAMRPVVAAAGARRFAMTLDRAGIYARTVYNSGTVIDGAVVNPDGTTSSPHRENDRGDVVEGTVVDAGQALPRGH